MCATIPKIVNASLNGSPLLAKQTLDRWGVRDEQDGRAAEWCVLIGLHEDNLCVRDVNINLCVIHKLDV